MALFHFSAKIISRSNGQSACAAAAYRSGEKIVNEYDGIVHDYRCKQNVEDAIVILPVNAPPEYVERSKLWNSVELNEKQANAQLSREIEFSLPRELDPLVRKKIALEFIQENFVDQGMVADVCFHNPPKMNSMKKPIDAAGNILTDPDKYIYENPHVHVMLTLRPLDANGKWEAKKKKLYVCEKDGERQVLSAAQIKKIDGCEKLFNYKMSSGRNEWHTKSYAMEHKDECIALINRYPKCEQVVNPIINTWNNPNNVELWRAALADKINTAYEQAELDIRVDHRSYKRQGLDIIPTIHEGKSVTIFEKKLQEDYNEKIRNGEIAVRQHTDIRNMNNAIREHNNSIMITQTIKKLQIQMQELITPVIKRWEQLGQSLADKLERLRVDIIFITTRLNKLIETKGVADNHIIMNQQYVRDLAPTSHDKIDRLKLQIKALKKQYTTTIFTRKKEELSIKIENLQNEIDMHQDNAKYALQAMDEIEQLKNTSHKVEVQIEQLSTIQHQKLEEYHRLEQSILEEDKSQIKNKRLLIRSNIEMEFNDEERKLYLDADRIDRQLGCTINELLDDKIAKIDFKFR